MKKLLIVLMILPFSLIAQTVADFEDGTLDGWTQSTAGRWAASTDSPIDGAYSLHHIYDNPDAGADAISHSLDVNLSDSNFIWRFQVRYGYYSPSSNNNWAFFLTSDKPAVYMFPDSIVSGYVVGVNFTGSDDMLKIWKIVNGNITEVLNSGYNWDDSLSSTDIVGIEVQRTQAGEWTLFIDDNGGFDNLVQIGSQATDAELITSRYFGVYYKYTSAQDQKLWIDDVYPILPDRTPPYISFVKAISKNTLKIYFSEKLGNNATDVVNYTVDNGIGQPSSASFDNAQNSIVSLTFANDFPDAQTLNLQVKNVTDAEGNAIADTVVAFAWEDFKIMSVKCISWNKIDVKFNKKVDNTAASDANNFVVDGTMTASTAIVDATDQSLVHLTFSENFQNNTKYNLVVSNVTDETGNPLVINSIDFIFHLVASHDVVFNELMIDVNPNPPALPAHKYIEIYNASNYDVDMTDWSLKIGTYSPKTIGYFVLKSGEYAIICSDDAQSLFVPYGKTIPVLKESYLTSTTGKRIILKNEKGETIDDITYYPDWYGDEDKADGGWSLERIDPYNICNQDGNWTASNNPFGGTPGFENSVRGLNPDTIKPTITEFVTYTSHDAYVRFSEVVDTAQANFLIHYLLNGNTVPINSQVEQTDKSLVRLHYYDHFNFGDNQLKISGIGDYCGNVMNDTVLYFTYQKIHLTGLQVLSDNQLKLTFSEPVDETTAQATVNYSVDEGIGYPSLAVRASDDNSSVYLMFQNHFPENKFLTLSVRNVEDLYKNAVDDAQMKFVYHVLQYNDLVINEILYNPYSGGSDFVELYNRSGYPLNMQDFYLATYDDDNNLKNVYPVTDKFMLIDTNAYVVLTEDTTSLQEFYRTGGTLIQMKDLPSMPDDEGLVTLIDARDSIIDQFHYNDDMQIALLQNTEGVSLERIDYNHTTQDSTNWTSAASSVGYATPGYKNSQYKDLSAMTETVGEVSLDNQVFSPDNDGYEDRLYITYKFEQPGFIADVLIFDKNGVLVRHLEQSVVAGTEGYWIWDGLNDDRQRVRIGLYGIVVKVFDLDGKMHIFRKTAVVAGKK